MIERMPRGRAVVPASLLLVAVALVVAVAGAAGVAACGGNLFTTTITPVPPVHRMPADVEGVVVLVDEDPVIETKDPVHIARAREARVPQDFRASMVGAFELAGFRVVASKDQPHDLVAKLALRVDESDGKVHQVYRCGLRAPDGTEVLQIDWAWPEHTYVDVYSVYDFATHNVATEIATSRKFLAYLRARGSGPEGEPRDPGETGRAGRDAGASVDAAAPGRNGPDTP
jgi:hypothetical protein